jgi:hypothetical protein
VYESNLRTDSLYLYFHARHPYTGAYRYRRIFIFYSTQIVTEKEKQMEMKEQKWKRGNKAESIISRNE